MSKHDLERDLRRVTLMIALLVDADEKFEHTIKVIEHIPGVVPINTKGSEDLVYLRRKRKYLLFLLLKGVE